METPEKDDRADSSHAHANIITNGSSIRMQHNSQNDSSSIKESTKSKTYKTSSVLISNVKERASMLKNDV
ncbi:hypothetical protein, partial [Salmonella enterica]|uniref:hypothetical protein n=1 Tax=Salmonella enterica TaxID=28901 RepID=UPI0020C56E82